MTIQPDRILETITCPSSLKAMTPEQLDSLAAEIRERLIQTTSCTGGHLAPSLGVVELTIGIHRALDCPTDRLIWDVGHQAYPHKLLTGRCGVFDSLRTYGGISGFTKRHESEYDVHDSGHASDSLSIALGLALARDAKGGTEEIVAVIGDGSMTGGMAFEAMNYIGYKKLDMTIVLNDNEMSISKNVGAMASHLGRLRLSPRYVHTRDGVEKGMRGLGRFGGFIMRIGTDAKEGFKQVIFRKLSVPRKFATTGSLFEALGITYVGPIDGHDIEAVQAAIEDSKRFDGPVLVHAVTRKGEGYEPALCSPDTFHGVGAFDIETGTSDAKGGPPSFTSVFSTALIEEAKHDDRIVAITAAMPAGTGVDKFAAEFPGRAFDVGIAEGQAVGMAAGLALGGMKPVVAIYSTFLQRAYDQVVVNVALQDLPVVIAVDRAGLVGEDGPTHHGVFDIAFLRTIPNLKILSPSNEADLSDALHTALADDGPVVVRYPRGTGTGVEIPADRTVWRPGEPLVRRRGADAVVFAVGRMVGSALGAAEELEREGLSVGVVDVRWIKPFDLALVHEAAAAGSLVVTLEEGALAGGFGEGVVDGLAVAQGGCDVLNLGLSDEFQAHGATDLLLRDAGLDAAGVAASIRARLSARSTGSASSDG